MIPVIALVGRPNVGKSTLFNYLTRTRDALVADYAGLTRDRKYGKGQIGDRPYLVIDTGGLSGEDEGIDALMAQQTMQAITEADVTLFMVDAHAGPTAADDRIARQIRQMGKTVYLVVNKIDGLDADSVIADFYELGLGEPFPVAANRGGGIKPLIYTVLEELPQAATEEPVTSDEDSIRVAILGRPNVGKSTLVNRLIGEQRVLAFDMPGTTRDSIFIPFEKNGQAYTLIDTAGVRRRSRVHDAIEKFSVIKAMQAIEEAHVVIVVLDAQQEVSDQDATLLGFVLESGRSLILAINKWDGLDEHQRERIRQELDYKLSFLDFAERHFISALHGTGVGHLLDAVQQAYSAAMTDLPTPRLTTILEQLVAKHQPPMVRGRRIKPRYAHQGGRNPPLIVIHGNQVKEMPDAYTRYLINAYRKQLHLVGTPLRIEYREGRNPYQGRKNVLTDRQIKRKKRLVKHVKKGGRSKK